VFSTYYLRFAVLVAATNAAIVAETLLCVSKHFTDYTIDDLRFL